MLDVYLGEDGWSKRAGEAAKNMKLLAKIDLFILQRLKAKLGKSIPRVQMLLAKLTPMQLFDLELCKFQLCIMRQLWGELRELREIIKHLKLI